jgi:ATP-binding cassette subfamily B protein
MWMTFRSITADPSVKETKLKPGTVKRILGYSHKYRSYLFFYLATVVIDAFLIVSTLALFPRMQS